MATLDDHWFSMTIAGQLSRISATTRLWGMNFWGADTELVLEHARALRTGDERMAALREALDPVVASVSWVGPDAETFRERWQGCRAQITEVSGRLGSGAEHLAREAAQQDGASDPSGQVDPDAYDGLLGGESWSDVINFFERAGDPFRDNVDTESLGGSYADENPDWAPEDVGVTEADIRNAQMQQGTLGDCWYLAAIMSAQQTDPGQLAENINGLGSPPGADGWEVDLFVDGEWQSVPVGPQEITNNGTMLAQGDSRGDGEPGFMSVYERALINAHEGRPSDISADTPAAGIEMITGRSTQTSSLGNQPSFDEYRAAIDADQPVTVMTDPIRPMGSASDDLVAAHVYQVSGYDESTGEIILTNPHGPNSSNELEIRLDPSDPTFAMDIVQTGVGE